MNTAYQDFLQHKAQLGTMNGFAPLVMPEFLFDFQQSLVDWSLRAGRSAIFADCGLGKTPMQLVWADNVVRHTNGAVLILTPLAVNHQTVAEAAKFDIEATRIATRADVKPSGIHVINYEKLHHLDWQDFDGVVCDESSILKSCDGATRVAITQFMRKIPHRLLCTATAAPNDYHELGTSSEALGYLGHVDMLTRFFKNDRNNVGQGRYHGKSANFRIKGHAETHFWRWVCSWARACRRPSDLGFNDASFTLPSLTEQEHIVEARSLPSGMLFNLPARGLNEQRDERRRTIQERCDRVAELVTHDRPALVWGHLNDECDLLEKLIPGAVQVSGNDDDDVKERKFVAFASGEARVLVTKPTIGAWGLNFQHCAHVTFFPSHSFEQYYQGVRRCWRFGQTQPVQVDIVTTEGERGVLANLTRKAKAADVMFSQLVTLMRDAMNISIGQTFSEQEQVPTWLSSTNS
jgi:hypothetical protein